MQSMSSSDSLAVLSVFEFENLPQRVTAVIHLKVPCSDMPLVFGPAIGELLIVLSSQGIQPDGAAFAHHFEIGDGYFDFDVGFFLPFNSGDFDFQSILIN